MEEISDVVLKRKYYFQQPIQKLFEALIYREVPELPLSSGDRINMLYAHYDEANNMNRSFEYHQQITLQTITMIKCSVKRYKLEMRSAICRHKCKSVCEKTIWQYINQAVIVRLHEPFTIDDVNVHFKFLYFETMYHYLEFEKKRGTAIKENLFLFDISNEYNFDLWYLNKLMTRGALNNVEILF